MAQVKGDGVPSLYVAIIMMSLCWIIMIMRLGVRQYLHALGLDDLLMFIGLILYSITACLVIVACFYGSGQHSKDLSSYDIMHGTKIFYIAEYFYSSCTVPIKCSICMTLLRIADSRRRYTYTIWAIMGMTITASIIFIVAIANICHPITTLWGETTHGTCNLILNSSVSFFFSAVSIVTDWTLAILPGALLWKVQMKGRVKFSVGLILSLAAFASCATIVRLRYLTLYNDVTEFMFGTGAIGLWSILEEGIGIIAGSMPALRPLLNMTALRTKSDRSGGSGAYNPTPSQAFRPPPNRRLKPDTFAMDTMCTQIADEPEYRKDQAPDSDGDSQRHILKETQVTVTSDQGPAADDWAKQQVLGWKN